MKNERVRVSLLTLQETEKQLDASSSTADKVSVYETLMKELIDAQQALREELKDDQVTATYYQRTRSTGSSPRSL